MSKPYKGFKPNWENEPPKEGTYRAILKWGDPNEFKSPNEMLYQLMKERFQMTDEDFKVKKEEGLEVVPENLPLRLDEKHVQWFEKLLGTENVKKDVYNRLRANYGKTMLDALRLRKGRIENLPDLVLYPNTKEEIEKIVAYCNENLIPLYARAGGSTVTRGIEAVKGGVLLDLWVNFNKVVDFNEKDQVITVESGMSGPKLEETLNQAIKLFGAKRAYTCGHFPQSFEYSAVGGWVVTRGAGQNSSYYGKIEDIVFSQEYATPIGNIKTEEYPAAATGPSMNEIMMGSEGTFGILTHVKLRFFRYMPENRYRFSYIFPTWEKAQDAAREITQGEFGIPSVFRLSDPEETDVALKLYGVEETVLDKLMEIKGFKKMERCLFLGFTDGEHGFTRNMKKKLHRICKNHGAMYLTGYPTKGWEKGRFRDPYLREALQDFGIVTDTLECSVTWDSMPKVHEGVRKFCKSRPNTVVMTHMSHVYPQGANLYFIFIGKMDYDEYVEYQAGILDQYVKFGASMSHHHGIGKSFAPWLEHSIGSMNMEVYRTLKNHFDPNNIMNPGGTLGIDLAPEERRKL